MGTEFVCNCMTSQEIVASVTDAINSSEVIQNILLQMQSSGDTVENVDLLVTYMCEFMRYATGILVFFAVVVLCYFGYKFLRIFF